MTETVSNPNENRVTVRLSGDILMGVREILAETPASSDSEVVRRALFNYIKQFRKIRAGATIIIETNVDGKVEREPVFL